MVSAVQRVIAALAEQPVAATIGVDRIVAQPAEQVVGKRVAVYEVVADRRAEHEVAGAEITGGMSDDLGRLRIALPCESEVDIGATVDQQLLERGEFRDAEPADVDEITFRKTVEILDRVQLGGIVLRLVDDEGVRAKIAIERVVAEAAAQDVVAVAAVERVVAARCGRQVVADQLVIAIAAKQGVIAIATLQEVIAEQAGERVIAAIALDIVVGGNATQVARQGVVVVVAGDNRHDLMLPRRRLSP